MPVTITIKKTLEEWWASDEEYQSMSDAQIVELCQEEITAAIDGAQWTVERSDSCKPK